MTFRFGPFEADRRAYRTTRNGATLDLTPKLLDLLFHFLERPGVLITKEELLDSVWPGANVTENAMAQAISDLREALGDDAGSPKYIRTIARRGYRFIADVATVNATLPPARVSAASAVQSLRAIDERETVAVMDFVNVTNDPEVAWLGAGIAETVSTDLAALDRYHVVDRWRILDAVRFSAGSPAAAGTALGATQLVTGSYQRSGPRLRITARLVTLADSRPIADVKVDGRLDDVFALQDGIGRAFARDLQVPLQPANRRAGARETSDLDAYRAYIEGWLRIESLDLDSIPEAIADFERAIAIDPRFASAYTGLATAEWIAYEMGRATRAPNFGALRRGIEHSRLAVQLDPDLADAHAALSFGLTSALQFDEARQAAARAVSLEPDNWRHQFRLGHAHWGEARLAALARALELYPHFAYTRLDMAMVLVARGQFDRALDLARLGAAEQDRQSRTADRYPAIGFHFLIGALTASAGRYADALPQFDSEVEQAGQRGLYRAEYAAASLVWRGFALLHLDRIDEAAEAFRSAEQHVEGYPRAVLGQATVLERRGQRAEAAVLQRQVHAFVFGLRQPDRTAEWLYGQACLAAAALDAEGAASALNQLFDSLPPSAVAWQLPIEPVFLGIRQDPRFAEVLGRLADRAK
jgi:DNA-binding winged helix-turn-helix (wHTH) protein